MHIFLQRKRWRERERERELERTGGRERMNKTSQKGAANDPRKGHWLRWWEQTQHHVYHAFALDKIGGAHPRAVEDGDAFGGLGHGLEEVFGAPRTVQTWSYQPNLTHAHATPP